MPRTALSVVTTAAQGVTLPAPAAVDAANGNSFLNTGRELIQITNGSASAMTVTFKATYNYVIGAVSYPAKDVGPLSIPAGATKAYGPFDRTFFNDPNAGTVGVDFSSGTSVTALVVSLGFA